MDSKSILSQRFVYSYGHPNQQTFIYIWAFSYISPLAPMYGILLFAVKSLLCLLLTCLNQLITAIVAFNAFDAAWNCNTIRKLFSFLAVYCSSSAFIINIFNSLSTTYLPTYNTENFASQPSLLVSFVSVHLWLKFINLALSLWSPLP